MPTFDFTCTDCNHLFEFSRPFGSKTKPKCPACQSKNTEKQVAPPTIHFKGAGFYKTDSGIKPEPKKTDAPAATPEKPAADAAPKASDTPTKPVLTKEKK